MEPVVTGVFAPLHKQVTKNTTVFGSVDQLVNGIAAQIVKAKADPIALQALIDELQTNAGHFGTAVDANIATIEEPSNKVRHGHHDER